MRARNLTKTLQTITLLPWSRKRIEEYIDRFFDSCESCLIAQRQVVKRVILGDSLAMFHGVPIICEFVCALFASRTPITDHTPTAVFERVLRMLRTRYLTRFEDATPELWSQALKYLCSTQPIELEDISPVIRTGLLVRVGRRGNMIVCRPLHESIRDYVRATEIALLPWNAAKERLPVTVGSRLLLLFYTYLVNLEDLKRLIDYLAQELRRIARQKGRDIAMCDMASFSERCGLREALHIDLLVECVSRCPPQFRKIVTDQFLSHNYRRWANIMTLGLRPRYWSPRYYALMIEPAARFNNEYMLRWLVSYAGCHTPMYLDMAIVQACISDSSDTSAVRKYLEAQGCHMNLDLVLRVGNIQAFDAHYTPNEDVELKLAYATVAVRHGQLGLFDHIEIRLFQGTIPNYYYARDICRLETAEGKLNLRMQHWKELVPPDLSKLLYGPRSLTLHLSSLEKIQKFCKNLVHVDLSATPSTVTDLVVNSILRLEKLQSLNIAGAQAVTYEAFQGLTDDSFTIPPLRLLDLSYCINAVVPISFDMIINNRLLNSSVSSEITAPSSTLTCVTPSPNKPRENRTGDDDSELQKEADDRLEVKTRDLGQTDVFSTQSDYSECHDEMMVKKGMDRILSETSLVGGDMGGSYSQSCVLSDSMRDATMSVSAFQLKDGEMPTSLALVLYTSIKDSIQEFNLSSCESLTESALILIWGLCPHLRSLNISNCHRITDQAFVRAIRHPCKDDVKLRDSLQVLDVSACAGLSDFAIEIISQNHPHLRSLNLSHCQQVTDISLMYLAERCHELDTIKLNRCVHITDDGVLALLEANSMLRIIALDECQAISNRSAAAIMQCASCTSMSFSGCLNITDDFMKSPGSPVTDMNLSWCRGIQSEGVLQFCVTSASGGRQLALETLDIAYCTNLDAEALSLLCSTFSSTLKNLNLSLCRSVTDRMLLSLSQGKVLKSLKVSWCRQVTDRGVLAIAESCSETLEYLDISHCTQINDQGIVKICTKARRLHHLDVSECTQLTDAAVDGILLHSKALRSLKIAGCTLLTDASGHSLLAHCLHNENHTSPSTILRPFLDTVDAQGCVGMSCSTLRIITEKFSGRRADTAPIG